MRALSALRSDPYLPPMLAYVHVLCRPILVWPINRFFSCLKRGGIAAARYSMNRWGFIKLVHPGDREDPGACKPLARTFRPWADASGAGDLPANLAAREPSWRSHASPHQVGGGVIARSAMTQGAFASLSLGSTWPCLSSPLAPG